MRITKGFTQWCLKAGQQLACLVTGNATRPNHAAAQVGGEQPNIPQVSEQVNIEPPVGACSNELCVTVGLREIAAAGEMSVETVRHGAENSTIALIPQPNPPAQ